MKVNQEMRSNVERMPARKVDGKQQRFETLVQSQSHKLKREELAKLMEDISEQGKKIARFRSFKDLAKFKRMIKQFLQETVYNGLELKESRSFHFNMNSSNHKLTTVKEIDDKLIRLTEDVMDQEKKSVDLLAVIGEIEGLLINLYT